jgi:hypothetical protein
MRIERSNLTVAVTRALRATPIVALLGPRQCGKTTLARDLLKSRAGELDSVLR